MERVEIKYCEGRANISKAEPQKGVYGFCRFWMIDCTRPSPDVPCQAAADMHERACHAPFQPIVTKDKNSRSNTS